MPQLTPNPPIQLMAATLYPQMDTPDEVIALAKSRVTSIEANELHALFMIYHNTIINGLVG